ncbi:alpha/beta hydrolase [Methylobacterium tarhaniae]|uniref:Alpha/beta hydrolase n=1 Tax=Methylobacterium tarhaniae TaxID=1187852 RepID=A0A0J6SHE8_9HYPH|nr:alpha/beta fold hydrolase [Methylobacterium tarhaniae]KMO34660.1 alpha/beta hydrolase [Methylobacterium tarhaniae]
MTPIEPATRRIPVRGLTLNVAEAGPADGPLTVLLHGFPETWSGWRHQIGPLAAAGLRVVAPDQRGYGLSSRPEGIKAYHLDRLAGDVIGLADALGHERIRLVGHDWGGLVAWWVASHHPDRLERVAILNAPHPDVFGAYARRHPSQALRSFYVGLFQLPGLPEALLRAGDCAALRRALTSSSRTGAFSPDDLDLYAAAWRRPGAITAMLNWYRALRLPRQPAPAPILPPVLVLWGERDTALERGLAAESLRLCAQGAVRYFPDATHWLQHEEPEAVNAALIGFLTASAEAQA